MTIEDPKLLFRWMTKKDASEMAILELLSFRHDNCFDKRTLRRISEYPKCLAAVCYDGTRLCGHLVAMRERSTLILISLAVHFDYRRIRVGSSLLSWVIRNAPKKIKRVLCMAPDDSLSAHMWLKAIGFRAVKVFPDYFTFSDGSCDGYRFELDLR